MEGILLTTDQIEWFREMLVESFDDEDVQHADDIKHEKKENRNE